MELLRALGALAEPPRPELAHSASALGLGPLPSVAAHQELFGHQLPPFASIYLGAEGMLGGEAADRVSGFWRALGQEAPRESDHLTVLLGLAAHLADLEERAPDDVERTRWRHVRTALVWEHVLSWLPLYLGKISDLGDRIDPFYRAWAELLGAVLSEVAKDLALPSALPLAFRAAPPLETPELEGSDAILTTILAPVRSGWIVCRFDLVRAGQDLGIGCRVAERRRSLRALLEQDIGGVLGWLSSEVDRASRQQIPERHGDERLATFWRERGVATAEWLGRLRDEARRESPT
jgi:hypothetical protein